jgi:hypothetical protein
VKKSSIVMFYDSIIIAEYIWFLVVMDKSCFYTTSIRKVMRISLVIRDVTSYRGVPYMARKLLKFPIRWRKFPCVNVRKIADV